MSSAQSIVGPRGAGTTLQEFLSAQLTVSRNQAKHLIDTRGVFVNGRRVWMARHRLQRGDRVEIAGPARPAAAPPPTPPARAAILYQDEHFLVANKPAGRLSNGPDSLESDLQAQLALPALAAAHRLDRETSGCLLFAKQPEALAAAIRCFAEGPIRKIYHAVVNGHVAGPTRTITAPIDRQPAVTHFRVLDANAHASHLSVRIETGRTHQIRKHLEGIGHPVLGDRTYGQRATLPAAFRAIERQLLHARRLELLSPLSGKTIRCEAPLPPDFTTWLKRLKLT
jgi:RluA family pseudouridine synthase